jgi:hypothetical protein
MAVFQELLKDARHRSGMALRCVADPAGHADAVLRTRPERARRPVFSPGHRGNPAPRPKRSARAAGALALGERPATAHTDLVPAPMAKRRRPEPQLPDAADTLERSRSRLGAGLASRRCGDVGVVRKQDNVKRPRKRPSPGADHLRTGRAAWTSRTDLWSHPRCRPRDDD